VLFYFPDKEPRVINPLTDLLNSLSASPVLITALVALMVLDYFTGTLKASITGTVTSRANWRGVATKTLLFLLVVAVAVVEFATITLPEIPRLPYLRLVVLGLSGAELYSILENVTLAGVAPKPVRDLVLTLSKHLSDTATTERKPDL
jgi:toxin secretion/phage lysis holin